MRGALGLWQEPDYDENCESEYNEDAESERENKVAAALDKGPRVGYV